MADAGASDSLARPFLGRHDADAATKADAVELLAAQRESEKLRRINASLIRAIERGTGIEGSGFAHFQTAAALGNQVQERTAALTQALHELERVNAALVGARVEEQRTRARLEAAIEGIDQGIILCDAQDRVVIANRRYRQVWGDLPAEPGTPFAAVVRAASHRVVFTPQPCGASWEAFRLERHREPGQPFVVQFRDGAWLQVSERRLADGGTVSLYTDITEVKREEARRREREVAEKSVLLQTTLDTISQGVSVFSANGWLIACNPGFLRLLFGEAGPLPPAVPSDTLAAACIARLDALALGFVHAHNDQGHDVVTRAFTTPSGRTVEVRRSLMPGGDVVAIFTDITDRLRYVDALREANETLERRVADRTAELLQANIDMRAAKAEAEQVNLAKTKFFAAANHDLLQPLAAARVFASALSERRLSAPNRELVRHALSALDSVDDLLTALLDVAKLDAGAIPSAPADFLLADVLRPLAEEYRMIAARRRLRLRVFAGEVVVHTDPRLLRRILRNLVSNALRYSESGGVLIGHRPHGGGVLVGVWDTGIGIAPEQHEEVFEEFRRLAGSEESARGAGLGLSIVQRICRMLGHRLVVRSVPGQGSLFGVVLPLGAGPPASLLRPRPSQTPAGMSLRHRTVQLIDDEPAMLQGLSVLLGGWGMQVRAGRSAAVALGAEGASPPELIIADFHLQGPQTGLDAIAALRRRWGDVPALVVTADHSTEAAQAVAAAGHHLMHKPVRPARLRSLITHVLGSAGKEETRLF